MEAQISSTFLSIQDRLTGVKMYQQIYNDSHELDQQLQSKIVDAYNSFIGFCIAASDFYTRGGFRKCLTPISQIRSACPQPPIQTRPMDPGIATPQRPRREGITCTKGFG